MTVAADITVHDCDQTYQDAFLLCNQLFHYQLINVSDLISGSVKKPKFVCSDLFFFLSDPCLSRRWKTEEQKASRLKTVCECKRGNNTSCFQGFQDIFFKKRRKNPYVEKSVSFFFLKCHISRDSGPVLWAGSSLVCIIKWPSNRSSSSGSSPSSGGRSRL